MHLINNLLEFRIGTDGWINMPGRYDSSNRIYVLLRVLKLCTDNIYKLIAHYLPETIKYEHSYSRNGSCWKYCFQKSRWWFFCLIFRNMIVIIQKIIPPSYFSNKIFKVFVLKIVHFWLKPSVKRLHRKGFWNLSRNDYEQFQKIFKKLLHFRLKIFVVYTGVSLMVFPRDNIDQVDRVDNVCYSTPWRILAYPRHQIFECSQQPFFRSLWWSIPYRSIKPIFKILKISA